MSKFVRLPRVLGGRPYSDVWIVPKHVVALHADSFNGVPQTQIYYVGGHYDGIPMTPEEVMERLEHDRNLRG